MTPYVEKGSDEERSRGLEKRKKKSKQRTGSALVSYEAAAEQPSGFSLNYINSCGALSWL